MNSKINSSLEKTVQILDCFKEKGKLGVTEIANMTNLSKSTVYDLINSLTALAILDKDEETKLYSLGLKVFEYGTLYSRGNNYSTHSKSIGRELSEKYQATCHIATYDKNEIIYLDKFEHEGYIVTSYSQIGKRVPMTVTGLGKAILAYLPQSYKEEHIYNKPLVSRTKKSITDVAELEADLERINARGYSIDNEESVLGLRCVATPIFNNKGKVVAAISVSLLSPYLPDERIPELAKDLTDASVRLSSLAFLS